MTAEHLITDLKASGKRGVIGVFVDGECVLELPKDLVNKLGLALGQSLLPEAQEDIRQAAALHETKKAAVKALGRRSRTREGLGRDLLRRGFPESAVADVLQWLADRHYLNDELYARSRLETLRQRKLGTAAIQYKLLQEGVPREMVESVLAEQARDFEETEVACELATRHDRRWAALEWPRRRQKIYQLLARRGFTSETIREALARIESEDSSSEVY